MRPAGAERSIAGRNTVVRPTERQWYARRRNGNIRGVGDDRTTDVIDRIAFVGQGWVGVVGAEIGTTGTSTVG